MLDPTLNGTSAEKTYMGERFLSFEDVKRLFGVSRSTVWRWQLDDGLKVDRISTQSRLLSSKLRNRSPIYVFSAVVPFNVGSSILLVAALPVFKSLLPFL